MELSPNFTRTAAADKASFIVNTYLHLILAIFAFVGIEAWLFHSGIAYTIAKAFLGVSWLLILGGFMVIAWLASQAAHTVKSTAGQYAALSVYVVAEALIFVPILVLAENKLPGTISSAAKLTLIAFGLLTAVVFYTRKNFSFLQPLMMWGGLVALLLIVFSIVFKQPLGNWFSILMILYAGGAILYSTSKVLHEFHDERHVAAALELFASIALLFWYILRLTPFFGDE